MTERLGRKTGLFLVLVLAASSLLAMDINKLPPDNWAAPATWSPTKSRGLTTQDLTNPLPFIPLAPCRLVDTRGNGAPITGGIFTGGADVRNYDVTGICGIPGTARALSLNFTVTGPGQTTGGFLSAWPTGGAVPPVSILNWDHVPAQIANAAVVPTNSSQSFTVNVSAPTHVIIDVNGYYYDSLTGTGSLANGEYFGIEGVYEGIFGLGGGVIFGINDSVNGTNTYGGNFFSTSTGTGSAGVHGGASGSTGTVYGVLGNLSQTSSGGSAGVRGVTSVGFHNGAVTDTGWDGTSGVQGRSGNGNGVAGLSSGAFGSGVIGSCTDTNGNNVVYGYLGVRFVGPYAVLGEGVGHFTGGVVGPTSNLAQPHPTDASREIDYSALAGPRSEVYFRGTAEIAAGTTVISVPEDFRLVASPGSYSTLITPVGRAASVFVVSEDENGIAVQSSRDVTIHYVVYAEREAFKGQQAIVANTHFKPVFEGKYFSNMPDVYLQMMVKNGTLNPDHTVNTENARAAGWTLMPESENRMVPKETEK